MESSEVFQSQGHRCRESDSGLGPRSQAPSPAIPTSMGLACPWPAGPPPGGGHESASTTPLVLRAGHGAVLVTGFLSAVKTRLQHFRRCRRSTFTFIKRLFSSPSLSAIRLVSSAYLRLLIFLLAILIPACVSSSPAILMMYSAYKLNQHAPNPSQHQSPFQ